MQDRQELTIDWLEKYLAIYQGKKKLFKTPSKPIMQLQKYLTNLRGKKNNFEKNLLHYTDLEKILQIIKENNPKNDQLAGEILNEIVIDIQTIHHQLNYSEEVNCIDGSIAFHAPSLKEMKIAFGCIEESNNKIIVYGKTLKAISSFNLPNILKETSSAIEENFPKFVFSDSGKEIFICLENEGFRLRWDVQSGVVKRIQWKQGKIHRHPLFLANGDVAEISQDESTLVQYNSHTGVEIFRYQAPFCISHDCTCILSQGENSTIVVRQVENPDVVETCLNKCMISDYYGPLAKCYSSKSNKIYFLRNESIISYSLDLSRSSNQFDAPVSESLISMTLSSTEKFLAVLSCKKNDQIQAKYYIHLICAETFKNLITLKLYSSSTHLQFTDNDHYLMCMNYNLIDYYDLRRAIFEDVYDERRANATYDLNQAEKEASQTKQVVMRACALYQLSLLEKNEVNTHFIEANKLLLSIPGSNNQNREDIEYSLVEIILNKINVEHLVILFKYSRPPIISYALAWYYFWQQQFDSCLEYLVETLNAEHDPIKKNIGSNSSRSIFTKQETHSFKEAVFSLMYQLCVHPYFYFPAIEDLRGYCKSKQCGTVPNTLWKEIVNNAYVFYQEHDKDVEASAMMNILGDVHKEEYAYEEAACCYFRSIQLLKDKVNFFTPAVSHLASLATQDQYALVYQNAYIQEQEGISELAVEEVKLILLEHHSTCFANKHFQFLSNTVNDEKLPVVERLIKIKMYVLKQPMPMEPDLIKIFSAIQAESSKSSSLSFRPN